MSATAAGTVYLVGAGPGDPGLLTLRGAELLRAADVVVYDGLVGDGLLELPRPGAEMIYAGKKRNARGPARSQGEISALIVERALAGLDVVRLKGGDPLVFGRVSEELDALSRADIVFEIVPGVSSLVATPAYAGIPITRRGVASSVAFATGHAAADRSLDDIDFAAFANVDTVVLFMAVQTLSECAARLIGGGRSPKTPAAAIYWGTTASQKTLTSTLGEIGLAARKVDLKPPALIVIGEVAAQANRYPWRHHRTLAGARVLVPRPRKRARHFADEVAKLGGEALIAPLTRFVRVESFTEEFDVMASRQGAPAARTDWLLFSSATAVEHFVAGLLETGRDLRAIGDARIGCVGDSTAAALEAVGLRADLVPPKRSSKGLAEALLKHLGEQQIDQLRVLVVRADGGRADAEDVLRAKGASCDVLALYRSQHADATAPTVARAIERLAAGEIDILPFFAPSQVRAFFELVAEPLAATASPVVAAVGQTTAAALAERGVEVDVVASQPDPAVFAAELGAAYKRNTNQP